MPGPIESPPTQVGTDGEMRPSEQSFGLAWGGRACQRRGLLRASPVHPPGGNVRRRHYGCLIPEDKQRNPQKVAR